MVRSFDTSPPDETLVREIFTTSLLAPTAGHSRGISWLMLIGPEELTTYFEAATDEHWRKTAARAPGLRNASAAGILLMDPEAYVARYSESDKATSGLGAGPTAWPVPYWVGDAGAASMAALLLIEEAGLSAAFLGAFRHEERIKAAFEIPDTYSIYGTILLGVGASDDRRSASLDRPGPTRAERVMRPFER